MIIIWPRKLLKRWILLSGRQMNHYLVSISTKEINRAIRWIEIYLVDSAILLLNNCGVRYISYSAVCLVIDSISIDYVSHHV